MPASEAFLFAPTVSVISTVVFWGLLGQKDLVPAELELQQAVYSVAQPLLLHALFLLRRVSLQAQLAFPTRPANHNH